MKKIIAFVLVALMVVPFGVFASAAKVTVPAEPTVSNDKKYYIAFDYDETKTILPNGSPALITNDGLTPETARCCNTAKGNIWGETGEGEPTEGVMYDMFKAGGTVVLVGKGHVGNTGVVPATATPILFTAVDGDKNYTSVDANGDPVFKGALGTSGNYANAGQFGMFMVAQPHSITFMGDVIFDDICFVERAGVTASVTGKIIVGATGKMVIGDNVKNLVMNPTHGLKTAMEVSEGGYLYIHSDLDLAYTGKGTIVVGDEIANAVNADTFAGFEGVVVKEDGTVLFGEAPDDNQGGNQGGNDDAGTTTPDNPETGDMTLVLVALAAISAVSAGAVLTLKKREER